MTGAEVEALARDAIKRAEELENLHTEIKNRTGRWPMTFPVLGKSWVEVRERFREHNLAGGVVLKDGKLYDMRLEDI